MNLVLAYNPYTEASRENLEDTYSRSTCFHIYAKFNVNQFMQVDKLCQQRPSAWSNNFVASIF